MAIKTVNKNNKYNFTDYQHEYVDLGRRQSTARYYLQDHKRQMEIDQKNGHLRQPVDD
jgi:hypothetical protein